MAKKKQEIPAEKREGTASTYYDLKTDAVDALLHANDENTPEVSEEELRRYSSGKKEKIPAWLKIGFIKFWFPAAACFFVLWGLGLYIQNYLDLLVVFGVILGIVTDLLTNNVLRFIEPSEGAYGKWMMFPKKKKLWTLFANIPYAGVLLFAVVTVYQMVNVSLNQVNGTTDQVYLGVEPIFFGFCYLAFDLLLIGAKNLFLRIIRDAEKKV